MQVPEAASPARRADSDAWRAHQRLSHPCSHSLDLELHLKTQEAPLLALADSLRAQLASSHREPVLLPEASAAGEPSGARSYSATHACMVSQLHACAASAACMLAVAEAVRFEGGGAAAGEPPMHA